MTYVRELRSRLAVARATAFWRLAAPLRSSLVRQRRVGKWLLPKLDHLFPRLDGLVQLIQGDPTSRYQAWVRAYDCLDEADLQAMRSENSLLAHGPLLSIIVPGEFTNTHSVQALVKSLLDQVYDRWELHLVCDATTAAGLPGRSQTSSLDERIVTHIRQPSSLAGALTNALRVAAGEHIVLVAPGVVLRPHALFLLAKAIAHNPRLAVVYADEDVVDNKGVRADHHFKPDWNKALLDSQNYFGGVVAFRRSVALDTGAFRDEPDEEYAWGLFLQITDRLEAQDVRHIPFVLSHRPSRVAPADRERVARSQEERLARLGRHVTVVPVGEYSYRTRYELPSTLPSVSVILPSTGNLELLGSCLDGLLDRTTYGELEILVVVTSATRDSPELRNYFRAVPSRSGVQMLTYDQRPFSHSRVNNWGVEHSRGELVCFLNDDTEAIGRHWLSAMVGHALQDRVGAVGALLYYPDDTIQHAGTVLVGERVVAHSYRGDARGTSGYHERALIDQDVSCVTAACMLVRREAFLDVGGFNEAIPLAFNDVDLCLRLREAGWRIVWTPDAEAYHRESTSLGGPHAVQRADEHRLSSSLIWSRWGRELDSDPHHNPNLSLDPRQLWEPAFPPRVTHPWRSARSSRTQPTRDGILTAE